MSWYFTSGETSMVKYRGHLKPLGMKVDDQLWQFQDLGGSMDGILSQLFIWGPSILALIHVLLARMHDMVQWFIWDPSISLQMRMQWTYTYCQRGRKLGVGGFFMSPFLFSSILQLEWVSKVFDGEGGGEGLCHQACRRSFE